MADTNLTPIALTQDDINLITRALRNMAEDTDFQNLKRDANELIKYIERENAGRMQTLGELFPDR